MDRRELDRLSDDEAAALYVQLKAQLAALELRLFRPPLDTRSTLAPDHALTAREAAPLVGMSPRWLYEHAAELPYTVYPNGPRFPRFDPVLIAKAKRRG